MNKKIFTYIIFISTFFALIWVFCYFVFIKNIRPITVQQPASMPSTRVKIQIPETKLPPATIKTFESKKLGIKFNYLSSEGDPVIEEGNTVYVGGKDGQWVEEFKKSTNDDLATAIKKEFLLGVSSKDCEVKVTSSVSVDTAIILITKLNRSLNIDDPVFNNNPCPANYRETNGIRYFWMDKNQPDRFFFFSIGQYSIVAEPRQENVNKVQKTWQDTFEIVI